MLVLPPRLFGTSVESKLVTNHGLSHPHLALLYLKNRYEKPPWFVPCNQTLWSMIFSHNASGRVPVARLKVDAVLGEAGAKVSVSIGKDSINICDNWCWFPVADSVIATDCYASSCGREVIVSHTICETFRPNLFETMMPNLIATLKGRRFHPQRDRGNALSPAYPLVSVSSRDSHWSGRRRSHFHLIFTASTIIYPA